MFYLVCAHMHSDVLILPFVAVIVDQNANVLMKRQLCITSTVCYY